MRLPALALEKIAIRDSKRLGQGLISKSAESAERILEARVGFEPTNGGFCRPVVDYYLVASSCLYARAAT
jgi:hypothetical protein